MTAQSPQANAPLTPAPANQGALQKFVGSFRGRLILALAATAVVPLTIADFIGYRLTQQRSQTATLEQLEVTAIQASVFADDALEDARVVPTVLAKSPRLIGALKTSIQQVEEEGLASLPIEVIDRRYDRTKVLEVFPELNAFLKTLADASSLSEIIVTESHGLNIALSHPSTDVVQSDEDWWQKTKTAGPIVTEPEFDKSVGAITFEITEVIRDPNNGQTIGVMKVGVPTKRLRARLATLLVQEGLARAGEDNRDEKEGGLGAEDVQLLDAYTAKGKPLATIGDNNQFQEAQVVVGGDRILEAAVYLRRVQSITAITPEEASEELANKFGLTPLLVERAETGENSRIVAIFEDENRVYSLAAVRGAPWVALSSTQKATIAAAGQELNRIFLAIGLILTIISVVLALLLARQLSTPLANLTAAARKVAGGNLNTRAPEIGTLETKTLAGSFNNLVTQVNGLLETQQQQAERDRLFANVALVGQSAELEAPLNAVMGQLRSDLKADRVVVYHFKPAGDAYIAAEDVLPGLPQALGNEVFDACIPQEILAAYQQGRVVPTEDVFNTCFHPEHVKLMERLEIKSSLVVPILSGDLLYGLLIAHHCQNNHAWAEAEIDYLKDGADRLGSALGGLIVAEQQAAAAEEQRRQREELEESVVALMSEIEGAADGDLTVRARLMAGDMGIVADLFNAVIENLQETAQQVKASAGQVSNSLGTNEGAIRELADKAISEASEIRNTLGSIEAMNQSILNVADNANQAAAIANDAFATARDGNSAMEQTVQGVLNLRGTIGETAKKMKRLGESAQKISQVVSLIDEIALKTNLLAINASVEANRAGEMGQGFTAVAQQVGSLAEQSAAAAKEIARSIAEIQLETQEAIAAMEQGTAEVVDNTRLVETTKDRLADVLNKSQEIDSLMRSISNATNSQAETSQVVATLMQQVTEASEARSMSSRQVAEAMQSTAAVAQSLQSSVEQFKVESV